MRFALGFLLLTAPSVAFAQANLVLPQTAGQNQVRWDKFDWQYVDLLAGPDTGAGLRLYYYKEEENSAKWAAAAIEEEYKWLVQQFDYRPQVRIPYILYNSHGELEETNVFQIGESTLGVTSPEDLRMTVAYWGDHSRFRHVSLHEMSHQFHIQKVNGIAERAKAYGSPLQKFPLWFTEGLAEYYSTPGGMDADAEEAIRDLVANPDPSRGFILPNFLSDEMRSFTYTYKLGQARVYFIGDVYGKAKIQEVLSTSYRLRGWRKAPASGDMSPDTMTQRRDRVLEFDELLERVTGDNPERMQAKWEDWLKRRYFKEYLQASQKFSDYRPVDAARQYPDTFVLSPDGNSMVYRGIEPISYRTRLYLADPRDPITSRILVTDSRPGVDTLHFFDRPVAAIDATRIAYVAREGKNDVLRLLDYKHSASDAEEGARIRTRARFRVSAVRRVYNPASAGIREMGSPAFSPDGKQLAFIGLDDIGIDDVWTLDLASGRYTRLTHDAYAEKELDWGAKGIVFASDATETRQYGLFLLDPETQKVTRISWDAANHRYPRFSPDGTTVAYSGDNSGKWDLYFLNVDLATGKPATVPTPAPTPAGQTAKAEPLSNKADPPGDPPGDPKDEEFGPVDPPDDPPGDPPKADPAKAPEVLVKSTDFPTGLIYPSFSADRLYALGMKSGRYRIFSIERSQLLSEHADWGGPRPYSAWSIPSTELTKPANYSIWRSDSWQLDEAFATLGGSTGVYGTGFVLFNDRMRDRTLYVIANAYGSFDLLDAQAVYLDRTRHVNWGTAAFLVPQPVVDPIYSVPGVRTILFIERKYGVAGIVEYPFNRYFRVGGSVGVAGTDRFIPDFYNAPDFGYGFGNDVTGQAAWQSANSGVQPELDTSFSLGYDTLALSYDGPLEGNSVVATVSTYFQPTRQSWFGDAQLDAQHYLRLYKTWNLAFRLAGGTSFGDQWKRPFYVSSVDNLRGVPWYSFYLINNSYAIGQAELHVPLNGLIRLLIFQNIIGVAGVDAGSIFDSTGDFDANKTAAYVLGFNFNLAIFQFRLHFAMPFDIGGLQPGVARPQDNGQPIVPNGWVTNFTIRYLFF